MSDTTSGRQDEIFGQTALLQRSATVVKDLETAPPGQASTASATANASIDTYAGQGNAGRLPRLGILRQDLVTFQRLEERDGVVLEAPDGADTVRVRLVDPRGNEPDQELDVERDQFSPADEDLIEPGAMFYWAIGYVTRRTGRRTLVLAIDFRRLPRHDGGAIVRARATGRNYAEEMGWT